MNHRKILTLETQAWTALTRSGSSLIPLLSRDCEMLFPGGMRLSEHSTPTLASVLMDESFTPWMRFRIYDESVVELGDGAGVIVYRVEAEREGQEVFRAFCSSIWRRRASPEEDGDGEGGWEMVVHQQTLM